ncbi:MAG: hypothetical protein OHK006_15200 [Thermodesulfovibrionales bacterium]
MGARSWVKGCFQFLITIALLTGSATIASALLSSTQLSKTDLASPTGALAVGPDSKIYVGRTGAVDIYSKTGVFERTFLIVPNVTYIAVNRHGEVYLVNRGAKTIAQYDASGVQLNTATLPYNPQHISFDAYDNVYVVTNGQGMLSPPVSMNLYRLPRNLGTVSAPLIAFGGKGPVFSAVLNGKIYVLQKYANGKIVREIERYGLNGVFEEKLANNGATNYAGAGFGQIMQPTEMVSDSRGYLFVSTTGSDPGTFKVVVLNESGMVETELKDENGVFNLYAYGLGTFGSGKVAVCSKGPSNNALYIFGVGSYSDMQVTPKALSFANSGIAPQNIIVSNAGNADISGLTFTPSAPWIRVQASPASVVSAGGSATIAVTAATEGLPQGTHSGTIAVSDSNGESETVYVTLEVAQLSAPAPSSTAAAAPAAAAPVQSARPAAPANLMVTSQDSQTGASTIRIFDGTLALVREFAPFGAGYSGDLSIASGDIDGDGFDEIIVSYGADAGNAARVKVFSRSGQPVTGADFILLDQEMKYGARVAAGDFDGDGRAEIAVSAGPGQANSAHVAVYAYREGSLVATGVNIVAMGSMYGANVAAGDVDGDGVAELVVAPGPDPNADAVARVFKIDTVLDCGGWSASEFSTISATSLSGGYGANVAAVDLNSDGRSEIILSSGTSPAVAANRFIAYNADSSPFGLEAARAGTAGGLEVAAGDADHDGRVEIATSLSSPNMGHPNIIISKNGVSMGTSETLTTRSSGAKVAFGRLGY